VRRRLDFAATVNLDSRRERQRWEAVSSVVAFSVIRKNGFASSAAANAGYREQFNQTDQLFSKSDKVE
jgi:hypothetical protein